MIKSNTALRYAEKTNDHLCHDLQFSTQQAVRTEEILSPSKSKQRQAFFPVSALSSSSSGLPFASSSGSSTAFLPTDANISTSSPRTTSLTDLQHMMETSLLQLKEDGQQIESQLFRNSSSCGRRRSGLTSRARADRMQQEPEPLKRNTRRNTSTTNPTRRKRDGVS